MQCRESVIIANSHLLDSGQCLCSSQHSHFSQHINVWHESIGFEPQIDGENDAGDYGGGAHDVCGNLAGDGRGDVPADEASDAQHDGGRPIDRALDDEYH